MADRDGMINRTRPTPLRSALQQQIGCARQETVDGVGLHKTQCMNVYAGRLSARHVGVHCREDAPHYDELDGDSTHSVAIVPSPRASRQRPRTAASVRSMASNIYRSAKSLAHQKSQVGFLFIINNCDGGSWCMVLSGLFLSVESNERLVVNGIIRITSVSRN